MALTVFRNLVASLCIRRMGYSSISTLSQLLLLFSLLSLIALVLGIMGGVTSELWEGWGKKLANRWRQGISRHAQISPLSPCSSFPTLGLLDIFLFTSLPVCVSITVSICLCKRLAGVRSGCFSSADGMLTKGDICTPAGPVCLLLLHYPLKNV